MPRLLHSFMYPVQKISLKLLMVHHYLRLLIKDRRNDCTINFKKTKIFIPTNSARYSNTKKFRHFQFYLEGIIIEYTHKRKKKNNNDQQKLRKTISFTKKQQE